MPRTFSADAVSDRIQSLLTQRQEHVQQVERIDSLLQKIGSVLRTTGGRAWAGAGKGGAGGRRRKRGKFAMSGEQSIISLIGRKGGATSQEIERHWKQEGRGGTAANMLSQMTKAKKLKRTPLKGQRGSTYTVP